MHFFHRSTAQVDPRRFLIAMLIPKALVGLGAFIAISLVLSPLQAQTVKLHPIEYNSDSDEWFTNTEKGFQPSGLDLDLRRFARIPNVAKVFNPGSNTFNSSQYNAPRLSSMKYAPGIDGFFVTDEGLFGGNNPAAEPESGAIYQVSSNGSNVRKVVDFENLRDLTHHGGGYPNYYNFQGGVRSIAFHPDFDREGTAGYRKLYTSQIEVAPTNLSDSSFNYLGQFDPNFNPVPSDAAPGHAVVSEWTANVDSSGNLDIVANSFREVFRTQEFQANHPLRQIAFDPHKKVGDADYGLLYVLKGDSYVGNLGPVPSDAHMAGNTAHGKLFRINPLEDTANNQPYSIPGSNPFYTNGNLNDATGDGFLDEIYTHGHRNPHTIAFAKDGTGDTAIFVSEIGGTQADEVNLIKEGGGNYGWTSREGTLFRNQAEDSRPGNTFVYPVTQYGRSSVSESRNSAVAGGFAIQNGSELDGLYFFADFTNEYAPDYKPIMTISVQDALGATLSGSPNQLGPLAPQAVGVLFDHDDDPRTASVRYNSFLEVLQEDDDLGTNCTRTDTRFAQGPEGEMYLMNKRNGWIYQVVNTAEQLGDLSLVVSASTGEATMVNMGANSIDISGYSLFSGNGVLEQSGWQTLQSSLGNGWQLDEPSSQVLREINVSGSTPIDGSGLSIGQAFSPVDTPFGTPIAAPDTLRFKYTTADGQSFSGTVEVPEASLANNLLLEVDSITGQAELTNNSVTGVLLRGYSIVSEDSLKPEDGSWNSLSDQSYEGFNEANPSSSSLSELIPFGADGLMISPGETFQLGDIFVTQAEGGSEDLSLTFVYEDVVFSTGDFNEDGIVDIADYTMWRDNLDSNVGLANEGSTPGTVTVEDYTDWKASLGNTAGGAGNLTVLAGVVRYVTHTPIASLTAVPEPSSFVLLLVVGVLTRRAVAQSECRAQAFWAGSHLSPPT